MLLADNRKIKVVTKIHIRMGFSFLQNTALFNYMPNSLLKYAYASSYYYQRPSHILWFTNQFLYKFQVN